MKLILAVTERRLAEAVMDELSGRGFPVTLVHEDGGLLVPGQGTLMVGAPDGAVDFVLKLLDHRCGAHLRHVNALLPGSDPTDLMVSEHTTVIEGGISIFVLPVRRFERFA
jgi:uncharacterized protein YaaQ